MEYLIGVLLALSVACLAVLAGLDRDRAFYPTVMCVIASYYVLFAVMGASRSTLLVEIAVAMAFLSLAIVGFKKSLWLVAATIVGHGVFDSVHHLFIQNGGLPRWWPGFCFAFDVVFGGALAVQLMRHRPASLSR